MTHETGPMAQARIMGLPKGPQAMSQFYVVDTARARYLMTLRGEGWSFMWGFSRVLRELPR